MLNEMGINVVEQEEGADEEEAKPADAEEDDDDSDGELVEAKPKALATTETKEPSERTDDPVRMYLREMGSVELLSREGEIAIAKRIEAGREAMIAGPVRKPADLPGHHHLARRTERRQGVPARHHRPRSDLRRPRRQEQHGDRPASSVGPTASRSRRPARRSGAAGAAAASDRGAAAAGRAAVGAAAADPVQARRRSRRRRRGEGGEAAAGRGRLRRRRHGEFAVARRDRGRAQAQGGRDLRQDRRHLQAAAPPAGPGHPAPAQERRAVAGAGAQVQEAQGRDHHRGEVAAPQPGAHRRAGRAALRHQQAPRRLRGPADAARRKLRRRRARTS